MHLTILCLVVTTWVCIFVLWLSIKKYYSDHNNLPIKIHPWWKKLNVALFIVSLVVFTYYRNVVTERYPVGDAWRIGGYLAGALVLWLGFGLSVWGRIVLGPWWSARPVLFENHPIIKTGPYRFTRHPIYIGVSVMLIGTFLATQYKIMVPIIAIMIVFFVVKARMEDNLLQSIEKSF